MAGRTILVAVALVSSLSGVLAAQVQSEDALVIGT